MIFAFVYSVTDIKNDFKDLDDFQKNSEYYHLKYRIPIMLGVATVILIPLNLLKDVSKLRFSTLLGLICLTIVTIVLCIQVKWFIEEYTDEIKLNWFDISVGFDEDLHFFTGFATIFFAASAHYGAFPIYDKLANNSKRRTRKVLFRANLLNLIFFLVVGTIGYLTQPLKTPDVIINRKSLVNDKLDIVMTICRALVAILLAVKIPMNYNPLRISILNLAFGSTEITNFR
jgi:amino acid permease